MNERTIGREAFRRAIKDCLDTVSERGEPLVVTYRGKPLVRIVPYEEVPAGTTGCPITRTPAPRSTCR